MKYREFIEKSEQIQEKKGLRSYIQRKLADAHGSIIDNGGYAKSIQRKAEKNRNKKNKLPLYDVDTRPPIHNTYVYSPNTKKMEKVKPPFQSKRG